jgi:polyisoprenoid-binding protein YceI
MIRRLITFAALLPVLAAAQATTPAQTSRASASIKTLPIWKIDVAHSELSFTIRHMVSKVRGQFDEWTGSIVADPADWSSASVEVVAQTSSINTNNERRDADLRSENHFDADRNPTVTFKSTKVGRLPGDSVAVAGNLTIHGITRPIVLRGHLTAITGVPGKRRAGFEAEATINRQDYNMTWNRIVEGTSMLGDDVKIEIAIAAVEQTQTQ